MIRRERRFNKQEKYEYNLRDACMGLYKILNVNVFRAKKYVIIYCEVFS